MARSFLSTLSRAARTAYPLLVRAAREGFSLGDTFSIIQDFGFPLRRETVGAILRHERDVVRRSEPFRFLKPRDMMDPRRIPEALGRLRREFSFTMEVRGFLVDTGQSVTQNITISSSTNLRREEMEALAIEAVSGDRDRYRMEVESVTPLRALRAGTIGTL